MGKEKRGRNMSWTEENLGEFICQEGALEALPQEDAVLGCRVCHCPIGQHRLMSHPVVGVKTLVSPAVIEGKPTICIEYVSSVRNIADAIANGWRLRSIGCTEDDLNKVCPCCGWRLSSHQLGRDSTPTRELVFVLVGRTGNGGGDVSCYSSSSREGLGDLLRRALKWSKDHPVQLRLNPWQIAEAVRRLTGEGYVVSQCSCGHRNHQFVQGIGVLITVEKADSAQSLKKEIKAFLGGRRSDHVNIELGHGWE